MLPKIYLGAVSINTIRAACSVANDTNTALGLIPSRRQVDIDTGYLHFTTKDFYLFVKKQSGKIILERDHGGCEQGQESDDGFLSFSEDARYFDFIHVDPFKKYQDLELAAIKTIEYLSFLSHCNPNLKFEIGTEEGIKKYSPDEFKIFLELIFKKLPPQIAQQILYLVVQGGTKVKEATNLGTSDSHILQNFIAICQSYDRLSKEHNGDYLSNQEIEQKFQQGLSALNIAPEFGSIETEILLQNFSAQHQSEFFQLVLESRRWVKWFPSDFKPEENQDKILKMCGHYVFENPKFKEIKLNYKKIDEEILKHLTTKILRLLELV